MKTKELRKRIRLNFKEEFQQLAEEYNLSTKEYSDSLTECVWNLARLSYNLGLKDGRRTKI